jgi:general secretion pathway protein G
MLNVRRIASLTHRRGFTLVEMIITVAIVALLASGALPLAELAVQRGKEQELRSALREIRGAIDAYKKAVDDKRIFKSIDASGYPPSLSILAEGVEDLKHPQKQKIYFLRRIPRDPFAAAELAAEETWGKRSYQSPPDAPNEGDDVFDVYSLSERPGINGVRYREW